MEPTAPTRLLDYARALQGATTFKELLEVTVAEIAPLGYQRVWLLVADHADAEELKLIDVAGSAAAEAWHRAPALRVRGDKMLEEMMARAAPVIVADARVDPRTDKAIVERWGNRTLIHLPLALIDRPFGALGVGTFADEGPRPPSPAVLDHLIAMSGVLSVAVGRVRFAEERAVHEAAMRRAEARLAEAEKLEALGQLAAGVAHDFNNLLTVILTCGSLLREHRGSDGDRLALLDEVIRAAERSAEITRELLAFGRRQMLEPQVIDLGTVVRELTPMARRLVGSHTTVEVTVVDDARVCVDRAQLERALVNLVINARDAMPGGGRLTVTVERAAAGAAGLAGPCAVVEVRDTGAGMDEATQRRAFEPFFTTKPHGRGTGLGLASVRGVIAQSGGAVDLTSAPGAGTCVTIVLPATAAATTAPPVRRATTTRAAGETVLVVDDDRALRMTVARALSRDGYRVLIAADAEEALALAERHSGPIDLLATDLVMPGLGGVALLERFATARPTARTLVWTAYAPDAVAWTSGPGRPPLLRKPFAAEALAAAVRDALTTEV